MSNNYSMYIFFLFFNAFQCSYLLSSGFSHVEVPMFSTVTSGVYLVYKNIMVGNLFIRLLRSMNTARG